jgi:hypothetical protein
MEGKTMRFRSSIVAASLLFLFGCSNSSTTGTTSGEGSTNQQGKTGPSKETHKIVGTWEFVKSSNNQKPEWGTKLEFTADGKVIMRGPGYANDGTYSVEKTTLKMDAAPIHEMLHITKLTDKNLVLEIKEPVSLSMEYRKQ